MEENKQAQENEKDVVEEVEDVEQEIVEETDREDDQSTSGSKVEALQKEKDEVYQRLLRVQAEYDNFRKRTQKEKEAERKYRSQSLITELLPVVDNFERALQTDVNGDGAKQFVDGIKMVYRQLSDALEKEGVEVIPTKGEAFDPHLHQAVMQVEDDQYDSNVVVEELQKGYKLKDRVIRPAMVKVNQ
ncbi:protein GrpE [Paraliobacillus quinghaiensis]|uniref:Protein GrpE n=1 Tax=Paraliobacillus quinghaiensis TaxID=470815 RepID=A0A917TPE3_9BACI|nr:nucleotide exchange factor GrpE [Paraliobacillus quinghaiensis]GGM31165.1 protein GrpE [Paraliobacillus quinghaiensis]